MKFKDVPKEKIHAIADSVLKELKSMGHGYTVCKTTENPDDDEEGHFKFEGDGLVPAELDMTASLITVMKAEAIGSSIAFAIDDLARKYNVSTDQTTVDSEPKKEEGGQQ